MSYEFVKYIHVLGGMVILGTGTGIAFFMLVAHLSGDVAFIARTAGTVVLADLLFTTTAIIVQPVTGYVLADMAGFPLNEGWVLWSLILYGVAGAFWIPVVWIQARMRDLARAADHSAAALPASYNTLFRTWFLFGIPGFGSVLAIVWLMVAKPQI